MFGTGEILVILCIILILFGGKKLPEFAKSLGQGIREFKKACQGLEEDEVVEKPVVKKSSETIVVEIEHDDKNNRI
ncbi:MAG: twin-arginine translocase TatA/TatE family subunit [Parachlamydiaceae bacterium]|nr:twin-arginine translocase TatA/TatE family subunit [Parachlamydiaceae bacterium]